MTRPGTGGEQDARRVQHAAQTVHALYFDAIGVEQHGAAADQVHVIARELRLQIAILGGDHRIDALQQAPTRAHRRAARPPGKRRCRACADSARPVRARPCSEWCPTADRTRRPATHVRSLRRENPPSPPEWRLSVRPDRIRGRSDRSPPAAASLKCPRGCARDRASPASPCDHPGNTPSCSNTGLSTTSSSLSSCGCRVWVASKCAACTVPARSL